MAFQSGSGTGESTMAHLLGEFECKLDAKGRVKIPAGLKRQFQPEDQGRFVVNRGFENCLVLYPHSEWEKLSNHIKQKLNPFKKKDRTFLRYFFRGATELTIDGSDRLLLPKQLLAYAEMGKEVVLFAHSNNIEIWDKSKYNATLDLDSEQFADLADEVMGGFGDDE